jgi:AraC family transcriptional regulator of adaptative response/methylated-DNA-[protein]-cysteine methyltransferase
MVAADEEAVYLVEFWDRRMLGTQFSVLQKQIGAVFFPGTTGLIEEMRKELDLYFLGKLSAFETPIQFPGSQHQQRVWRELLKVPRGQTISYSELARRVGKPTAVRSVARAVGENRLAIVVPCHRIVGASGSLTGYGGGVWRKRYLLALERDSSTLQNGNGVTPAA